MLTKTYVKWLLIAALGPVLLAGCTGADPVRVEQDFGKSVRNMVSAQIYDPEAARDPPSDPPLEMDGQKSENVLRTYRSDVSKPQEVRRPIDIGILR